MVRNRTVPNENHLEISGCHRKMPKIIWRNSEKLYWTKEQKMWFKILISDRVSVVSSGFQVKCTHLQWFSQQSGFWRLNIYSDFHWFTTGLRVSALGYHATHPILNIWHNLLLVIHCFKLFRTAPTAFWSLPTAFWRLSDCFPQFQLLSTVSDCFPPLPDCYPTASYRFLNALYCFMTASHRLRPTAS